MNDRRFLTLSLVACLLATQTGSAMAYGGIGDDWLAQYPDACKTLTDATLEANGCVLCHYADSNALNPYGSDLASVSENFVVAEGFDSDGDQRTNGEEILLDCTLPGDTLSVPEENPTWSAVKALFR